jgi:hypothetical protein
VILQLGDRANERAETHPELTTFAPISGFEFQIVQLPNAKLPNRYSFP